MRGSPSVPYRPGRLRYYNPPMRYQATDIERRQCSDRRHEERRLTRVTMNKREHRVGDRRSAYRREEDFVLARASR